MLVRLFEVGVIIEVDVDSGLYWSGCIYLVFSGKFVGFY